VRKTDFAVARVHSRGQVGGEEMENLTTISVHACYLLALVLFMSVAGGKYLLAQSRQAAGPPSLPAGKVQTWFYIPTDLLGVGLFFLVFYSMAIMGAMMADAGKTGTIKPEDLVLGIGIQLMAPAAAFALVFRRVNLTEWLGLAWKNWLHVLAIAPVSVFVMFAFSVVLYQLRYGEMIEVLGVAGEQDAVTLFREGKDILTLGLMAFAAVIVAPVCEEVVFRGYLYPVMKKYGGSWAAALASALIFSAAHGSVAAMVPLFIFGLLMVAVYEYTGSLWAPIGVHFLFNGSTVAIQLLARFADISETVSR
jgi:hypothetical protein